MTPDATPAQDWREQQRKFLEGYYGFLVGATVVSVAFRDGEYPGEAWPVLTFQKVLDAPMTIDDQQHEKGHALQFEVEVSQDEEGNGPGFLFGLPTPERAS